MTDFSITKAAFSGYGLFVRKPALAAVLIVLGIAASFGITAMMVAVAGPQMTQLQAMGQGARTGGAPPDPAVMLSLLGAIIRFLMYLVLIIWALAALNGGAVNRAVLRPKTSRFPFLGIGGDELRLLVVLLVLALIIGIPSLVLMVIGQIVTAVVAIGSVGREGMRQMAQGGARPGGLIVGVLITYGIIGILAFLGSVRFALSAAQTVAERGIRIFGSWQLLNGRYWKVVGAMALALASLIPFALLYAGILAGVAAATGVPLRNLTQPDYTAMASIFTPVMIVRFILGGVMSALAVIVTTSTPAEIYLAITGGMVAGAGDDDDDDDEEDWDD